MSDVNGLSVTGRTVRMKVAAALLVALVIGSAVALVLSLALQSDLPTVADADPGRLTEVLYTWEGEAPVFVDVTDAWGFGSWRNNSDRAASGGAVMADINRDGALDLVVAGGDAALFLAGIDGRFEFVDLGVSDTVAVDAGDLDLDGWVDIALGRSSGDDVILWGGPWVTNGGTGETTEVAGGQPTTGIVIARFSAGDELPDLLRLGYGTGPPAADVVFVQGPSRSFEPVTLPNSERRSLAAAVADVNHDGELDIWITRDIGWRDGGDSLLLGGIGYEDVAATAGADLEIDGMGVTLADLNGDAVLDAYLSDLGDNEILIGDRTTFLSQSGTGASRIRPPGSPDSVISSSWASGAADLNLDGILDLVVVNGGFSDPVPNKVAGTRIELSDPPALFLGLGDGRFADAWAATGLEWMGSGRGLALGDLDGDLDTDIVVVTRDQGLVVLRNDVAGPAVAVEVEPGCLATGGEVTVTVGDRTYLALLGAPTFLGRHAAQAIVGTRGEGAVVELSLPRHGRSTATAGGEGRIRLVLSCEGH